MLRAEGRLAWLACLSVSLRLSHCADIAKLPQVAKHLLVDGVLRREDWRPLRRFSRFHVLMSAFEDFLEECWGTCSVQRLSVERSRGSKNTIEALEASYPSGLCVGCS